MFKISEQKKMFVNLSASVIVLIINICINMFLSPIIVKKMGVEANGYVQLANNFLTYLTIISTALNSMASRFITIELHQNNFEKAKRYYSSNFWGNVGMLIILFVPLFFLVLFLNKFISIPNEMQHDVKLLFLFVFINFYVTTITPDWNTANFSTNNLYLASFGQMSTNIVRIAILFFLMLNLSPKMWYVSISMLIASVFLQIWTFYVKQQLLPELKVSRKYFNFRFLIELVSSGVWNSVNQLGVVLIQGMDLILSNWFLGPKEMGVLSLAKIFPSLMSQLGQSISNVFLPNFTILFAKNNINKLVYEIEKSSKLCSFIMNIIFVAFLIFGQSFFKLWVPSQNSELIQELSVLSIIGIIFSSGMQPLWQVFPTVNKLRTNSIVILISGLLSIITTVFFLRNTDWGLYAICGISSFYTIIKNIFFILPYSAKYIGLKKTAFVPMIIESVINIVVLFTMGVFYRQFIIIDSWGTLVVYAGAFCVICLITSFFLLFDKSDREILLRKFK